MRFHIKRTPGQGVTFEIGDDPSRRRPFSPFAMPDSLYRIAARRVIGALLEENQALRHNKQATMPAHLILVPRAKGLRMLETALMKLGKEEN